MGAEKDYLSLPLRELLEDIAAKSPTPGGGSVAALIGSFSCSLACMVIRFTVGKPKFAEHEPHLRQLLGDLEQAGQQFTSLMSQDMQAYEAFRAVPKEDVERREEASARVTAVPLDVLQLAESVVECIDQLKSFVNPHLLGDLRGAAILANAAARSAACTVRDNLPSMSDRQEAARLELRLDQLTGQAEQACDRVVHFKAES